MPEPIDPQITQQLNSICDAYARRQKLAPEDRQEIFDHLEDSLQGYLTGQTRVTPVDALLLAHARLGDIHGVVAQIRGQSPADKQRLTARTKVAATTFILTVLVLPASMLLMSPPAGRASHVSPLVLLLPVWFSVLEPGVFLAARTDMRSIWQRAVSLALIVPVILIFGAMLVSTTSGFLPPNAATGPVPAALMRLIAIACLAGHGVLSLMLIAPRRREASIAS